MILYVSGPMRGYPLFNFHSFENACRVLRGVQLGPAHTVFSPHEHDREAAFDPTLGVDPTPEKMAELMRWDLERVIECDAIVLLPGWQRSRGALVELTVAVNVGKEVYEFDPAVEAGMRRIGDPKLIVTLLTITPPPLEGTMTRGLSDPTVTVKE